jgi:hypothetical protein
VCEGDLDWGVIQHCTTRTICDGGFALYDDGTVIHATSRATGRPDGMLPPLDEIEAGRVLRILPASRGATVHDWIRRCWAIARVRGELVIVRDYDLFPGEPPDHVPLKERGGRSKDAPVLGSRPQTLAPGQVHFETRGRAEMRPSPKRTRKLVKLVK